MLITLLFQIISRTYCNSSYQNWPYSTFIASISFLFTIRSQRTSSQELYPIFSFSFPLSEPPRNARFETTLINVIIPIETRHKICWFLKIWHATIGIINNRIRNYAFGSVTCHRCQYAHHFVIGVSFQLALRRNWSSPSLLIYSKLISRCEKA